MLSNTREIILETFSRKRIKISCWPFLNSWNIRSDINVPMHTQDTLLNILPLTFPMNGTRWCSHNENISISFTITSSSWSSSNMASFKISKLKKEKVELKSSFKWSFKQLCYPTESANNINANDGTPVKAQDISLYLWANNIVIFCRLAIEAANF